MQKEQAIEILLTAARIGQAKGAYSLEDAKVIAIAVEVLSIKQTEAPKKEEVVAEEKKEE